MNFEEIGKMMMIFISFY